MPLSAGRRPEVFPVGAALVDGVAVAACIVCPIVARPRKSRPTRPCAASARFAVPPYEAARRPAEAEMGLTNPRFDTEGDTLWRPSLTAIVGRPWLMAPHPLYTGQRLAVRPFSLQLAGPLIRNDQ